MTCCPIAERPDVRQIDAALARGDSHRKVRAEADARSTELGVPPIGTEWAVRKHRQHVLARITGACEPGVDPGEADCCVIADRPDADEIDTDLRAGLSYRKVHAAAKARHPELSVNETTIWRHKGHLFPQTAATSVAPRTPAPVAAHTPAPVAHTAAPVAHTPAPVAHTPAPVVHTPAPVVHTPAPVVHTPAPVATGTPPRAPAEMQVTSDTSGFPPPQAAPLPVRTISEKVAFQAPEEAPPGVARRAGARALQMPVLTPEQVTARVLEQIAKLLVAGSWNGLSTVEALAEKHGVPVAEVERLHALAAGKVKAARGSLPAQLEAAIAATHWIFKDESETAAQYREEARKLFEAKDYNGAMTASKIATASHRLALEARKHLDEMTIKKPPTVAIHVAVLARPDFAAAFTIVAMILDGLWGPGAAARVERGLGAWEDMYAAGASEAQAREAVTAWLAEENETITAVGEVVEEAER